MHVQTPLVTIDQFTAIQTAFREGSSADILAIAKRHPEGVVALEYDHIANAVRDFFTFADKTEKLLQVQPTYCNSNHEWREAVQAQFCAAREKLQEVEMNKEASSVVLNEMRVILQSLRELVEKFWKQKGQRRG